MYIAVNGTPSHSYEVSLAIWDHTVLHDLGDLLHTEMVYPPADGHPSKY